MKECKTANATVRIRGTPNYDLIKSAAEKFVKEALKCKVEDANFLRF